jgi:hypothetical protein
MFSELEIKLVLFLGAFEKMRKAIINFVMSVCPSVQVEQLGSHWTDFHEIWYYFSKICGENSSFIEYDKNNGYFTGGHLW